MSVLRAIFLILRGLVRGRAVLALENLALRQQLAVLRRSVRRPRLRPRDRLFWVLLRRYSADWLSHLILVKPETVVGWHRLGFRLFWRWKSRKGEVTKAQIGQELGIAEDGTLLVDVE